MATPSDHDLLPLITAKRKRFWAKVIKGSPTSCWHWTGGRTHNGYGSYTLSVGDGRSRSLRAHRAAFMLAHGRPIAAGMTLHHRCHVLTCVNPAHLVEMTFAENRAEDASPRIERMRLQRRGRGARG